MTTLIIHIKQLTGIQHTTTKLKVAGKEMSRLTTLENAYLVIEDDLIKDFGNMESLP